MKFTVRMFASTQDGYQFVHKDVEIPADTWAQLMQWAVSHRETLTTAKQCADRDRRIDTMAPIYKSYGDLTRSFPLALAQDADIQAAIAHFFNLAIDNPEMLPAEVPAATREAIAA